MAHHGGRTVPRAHQPRAPTMSVHQAQPLAHHPLTAPLAPLLRTTPPPLPASTAPHRTTNNSVTSTGANQSATATTHVTLQAPRPDTERAANEYVETPFRSPAANNQQHHHPHQHHLHQHHPHLHQHHPHLQQQQQQHHDIVVPPPPATTDKSLSTVGPPVHRLLERPTRLPLAPLTAATITSGHHHPAHHRTVTKQPVAFTKEHPSVTAASATPPLGDACTIMCSECGRCRCESCRTPRPLPSCWVCDNTCLCSADTIIDYTSCLCCVKALYYHCSDSDAGATCADDPCSCGPHRRLARWGCLGALAVALPCLLCYWPLRGCQRGVEAAYARHSRAGCRCRPHQATPEKRLLDSSPEF